MFKNTECVDFPENVSRILMASKKCLESRREVWYWQTLAWTNSYGTHWGFNTTDTHNCSQSTMCTRMNPAVWWPKSRWECSSWTALFWAHWASVACCGKVHNLKDWNSRAHDSHCPFWSANNTYGPQFYSQLACYSPFNVMLSTSGMSITLRYLPEYPTFSFIPSYRNFLNTFYLLRIGIFPILQRNRAFGCFSCPISQPEIGNNGTAKWACAVLFVKKAHSSNALHCLWCKRSEQRINKIRDDSWRRVEMQENETMRAWN